MNGVRHADVSAAHSGRSASYQPLITLISTLRAITRTVRETTSLLKLFIDYLPFEEVWRTGSLGLLWDLDLSLVM